MKKVLIQRAIAAVAVLAIFHVNLAVAEPSTGINGNLALQSTANVVSTVNLYKPFRIETVVASAYNPGDTRQTDSTPCHGPKNLFVCDPDQHIIAANFLPLGTKVMIPKLGDDIYVVSDRMNARYQKGYIDIAIYHGGSPEQMKIAKADAYKFGRRKIEIVILEN